jgi:predicted nucleic acid-binding protein
MNGESAPGPVPPAGLAFVDSNVIVYMLDSDDLRKRNIASSLVQRAVRERDACISYQVVQEVLNRAIRGGASIDRARTLLTRVLMPLWRVMPSEGLHERGLGIHERYGYSFYDSLIIGAALEAGCTRLYSEDMQHGQLIESITIQDPFAP